MKKLVNLFVISFVVLLGACQSKHDTHYSLSDAQKRIVTTVNTVIWQNSVGLKDTAIVQPVVYKTYLLSSEHDGDTYGEKVLLAPISIGVFGHRASARAIEYKKEYLILRRY